MIKYISINPLTVQDKSATYHAVTITFSPDGHETGQLLEDD